MTWWLWLILAVMLAMGSVFFAFLCLSSTSAYGANYHSLTPRQRFMGKSLYIGSLIAAVACGVAGCAAVFLAIRPLLA
ncbi:MAG TPA: hypothetical protein VKM35_12725 [Arenimonas sp.]|uniref:hypothetical protein n=1 Tax=Arenimonas sp. TaxID=1872635 RepID=UPI002BAD8ABD|nr:hypothetical protein [Arenimonas sp.]HMB58057.1 hypothetical protein [Arenimonas sp.]